MAVKKLSAIANAPSAPALTDTAVGVGAGPTDLQYTFAQVAATVGLPPATGNITWYVSITGNDSNNGLTTGTAFATVQHAVNVAVNTNFQNLYQPTIWILDGNYTGVGTVTIPPLLNTTQLNIVLATTPVNNDPTKVTIDWFLKVVVDPAQTVSLNAVSATVSSAFPFFVDSGVLLINNCTIKFTCASGLFAFLLENATESEGPSASVIDLTSNTFDFTAISTLTCFCTGNGTLTFADNNVNFPASAFTISAHWLEVNEGAYYRWHHPIYSNLSSVTGPRIKGWGGGAFTSFTGCQADCPGTTDGPVASNFVIQADHLVAGTNGLTPISVNAIAGPYTGPPAPLNVPFSSGGPGDLITNSWMVAADRTNGQRWLAINDGGLNPANTAVVGTVHLSQIGKVVNTQTGAAYTLALTDTDGIVEMNNAGANTLTVPLNATVAFNIGDKISVVQAGAGATTIAAAGGVTVHNAGVIGGQWKSAVLYKRATDEWVQLNGAF